MTDPLGHVAGQNINAQGLASLRRDAEGNDTTFEYDTQGNIIKETDTEGGITTHTYDNNNRLTESRTRTVNGASVIDITAYEYNKHDRIYTCSRYKCIANRCNLERTRQKDQCVYSWRK